MFTRTLALFLILASTARADVDLSGVLTRLESIGLETATIRELLGRDRLGVPVISPRVRVGFFRNQSASVEAQYDWRTNYLSVPRSYGTTDGTALRADLSASELDTVIHELCHAEDDFADDVVAQLTRDEPTAAQRAKRLALAELQRQHSGTARLLRLSEGAIDHAGKLLPVSHWAAWEVAGYLAGATLDDILFTVRDIVNVNTNVCSVYMDTPAARAKWLATDDLYLPGRLEDRTSFGPRDTVDAYLFGRPIPYKVKGNEALVKRLWTHTLGLNAPADPRALVDRLNRLDNPWIRAVRQRVRRARADWAAAEAARAARAPEPPPPPATGPSDDELRGGR